MFIRNTYLFLAAGLIQLMAVQSSTQRILIKHCNWTQYPPDNYCTPENHKMKWKKPNHLKMYLTVSPNKHGDFAASPPTVISNMIFQR